MSYPPPPSGQYPPPQDPGGSPQPYPGRSPQPYPGGSPQPYSAGPHQPYAGGPPQQWGTPPAKGKRPGRIPLRLALIFGVIGIALLIIGGFLLANSSLSKIDGFARVSIAQGQKTVHLTRTGNYVGYYETPANASHRAFVQMRITDSNQQLVPLHLYATNTKLTYTNNGQFGQALFTFTINKPGDYQVLVRADTAPPGADVALGESVGGAIVAGIALLIPGLLLVVAAIVLLIVGIVRRTSYNRRMRAA